MTDKFVRYLTTLLQNYKITVSDKILGYALLVFNNPYASYPVVKTANVQAEKCSINVYAI
jgi:hypothetical protein